VTNLVCKFNIDNPKIINIMFIKFQLFFVYSFFINNQDMCFVVLSQPPDGHTTSVENIPLR